MVPFTMTRFAHMALETVCTVGVIGYSTPLVLVVLVPLALLYYLIQVQYSSPCMHRVVGMLSKIERSKWRKIYWLFHWFFGNNSLNLKKLLINQLDFGPFVSFTLHNRNCLHLPLRAVVVCEGAPRYSGLYFFQFRSFVFRSFMKVGWGFRFNLQTVSRVHTAGFRGS